MKKIWLLLLILVPFIGKTQERSQLEDSLYGLLETEIHDTFRIDIYNQLGILKRKSAQFDTASVLTQKAIDLARPLTNSMNPQIARSAMKGVAQGYNTLGSIHSNWGNWDKALENYFFSLKVKEFLRDSVGMAGAFNNIGTIYNSTGAHDKAIPYFYQAIRMNLKLDNKKWLSYNYNNLGSSLFSQGKIDLAREKYDSALVFKMEIGDSLGIAMSYNNLASIHEMKKEYPASLKLLFRALAIQQNAGDRLGETMTAINIGRVYYFNKSFDNAERYLHLALNQSLELGIKDYAQVSYHLMAQLDSAQGNYRASLENYKMSVKYGDSLKNEEIVAKSVQAEMQYAFDKRELEARQEQLEKEAVYESEIRRRNSQRNFFIGGFILVLLLGIVVYRGYREKKKANENLNEKNIIIEQNQREILDSIRYAKRIQTAILPPSELIQMNLPESFVLYKPKDVVAGDFFWFEPVSDGLLLAAADCTGHGVPGAMVSVICNNALNRAVREYGLRSPGEILDKTSEIVVQEFEKSQEEVKDGMDIGMVRIREIGDEKGFEINFAGAYNSLWIIRNGTSEVEIHAADKRPVGKYSGSQSFTTHVLFLGKGDCFYLSTDGYADQFGGKDGKKFKSSNFRELLLSIHHLPMSEQQEKLDAHFENWKGQLSQIDDVCVIGVRV